MIKHQHNEFPSDIFIILATFGAKLNILVTTNVTITLSPFEFLKYDMTKKIILNICLPAMPFNPSQFKFMYYKVSVFYKMQFRRHSVGYKTAHPF